MRANHYISEVEATRAHKKISSALLRGDLPCSENVHVVYQYAYDWYDFLFDQLRQAPESSERAALARECDNLVEKIEGLGRLSIESAWRRKDKL